MNEEFWGDLLDRIQDQTLVTVVGTNAAVVNGDDAEQTLSSLIGERLAERFPGTVSPGLTMDEAVAAFLRERGRDQVELRMYSAINSIIKELDPEPGAALRDLAAIDDLHLFVSTTPDRLLAKALNEVRFQGRPAREITFSLNQSTSEQADNQEKAEKTDSVVLSLFGQSAAAPQYAIHEEDRLEWIHALLSAAAGVPEWLNYQLKNQPMLFVGCELPDWFGRFLLRLSSKLRLSMESTPFFLAGCSTSREPSSLSTFLDMYCRTTLVQQLDMEPTEFVAELRRRWEQKRPTRSATPVVTVGAPSPVVRSKSEIFISYRREDAEAARRLCDAITALGGDAWLDSRRLSPGDAWQQEILSRIRRTVGLFIPIISANTERTGEGYVFREWDEAQERSRSILGRRFIVPVVVDKDYTGDPSRYERIPESFRKADFGQAPAGNPDERLVEMLIAEIRTMRCPDAA
jgi:hypothetical protein